MQYTVVIMSALSLGASQTFALPSRSLTGNNIGPLCEGYTDHGCYANVSSLLETSGLILALNSNNASNSVSIGVTAVESVGLRSKKLQRTFLFLFNPRRRSEKTVLSLTSAHVAGAIAAQSML